MLPHLQSHTNLIGLFWGGLNERTTPMAKPPKKVVYRDSGSGEFVTEEYAEKHKRTTERQHVPMPSPKPPKKKK